MNKVYVLFKDKAMKEVESVFFSPQSEEFYPDIVELDIDDERVVAFMNAHNFYA